MHIRSMGINFHEIVLPRKKSEISTPHKKPAIRYSINMHGTYHFDVYHGFINIYHGIINKWYLPWIYKYLPWIYKQMVFTMDL